MTISDPLFSKRLNALKPLGQSAVPCNVSETISVAIMNLVVNVREDLNAWHSCIFIYIYIYIFIYYNSLTEHRTLSEVGCYGYSIRRFGRFQWPRVDLRPLARWDCGFESRRGMNVFLLSVVCCQVEVSATSWSLVQRSSTGCGASLCVI